MDIFFSPSNPTSRGIINTTCGFWPLAFCSSRPISKLNFWSVPPSSTSVSIATES
ncbi:Uncharacterised protein [Vibrio cholerae]|nr:Uncharacterised protein [Vibrio cholerae]CSI64562.1 Uncharacterised protein [Vibrio cholerae]